MMSESTYQPVHLLSEKSRRLGRDTFFWLLRSGALLGGINQRITPLTSARLHRWIRLLDARSTAFEIYPVSLKKCAEPLTYPKERTGPNIPADSTDPLPAGDYAWNIIDQERMLYIPVHIRNHKSTFTEIASTAEKPGRAHVKDLLPWNDLPSSIEQVVSERDCGYCMVTGSRSGTTEICTSWIFPPAWAILIGSSQYRDPADIHKASNAMLIRKDLLDAFQGNAFGIDVDDDYRIVILRDMGPVGKLLTGIDSQAFFRRPQFKAQFTGPDEYFLRQHFKFCLEVHFFGGDIRAVYPREVVYDRIFELGIMGEKRLASFDDPRWETELGRELLECYWHDKLSTH